MTAVAFVTGVFVQQIDVTVEAFCCTISAELGWARQARNNDSMWQPIPPLRG